MQDREEAMEYKKNWKEVIERQTAFWERKLGGRILARIYINNRPFEEWLTKAKDIIPVESKDFPSQNFIFETWDLKLRIFKDIEDDSLPVMIPTEFDQGLFGGIFGAETYFNFDAETGWLSSMPRPFLTDYSGLNKLEIREDGTWMRELRQRLRWYAEQAEGKFGISPVISIDALNFAVMARGATKAMLDIYDNPQKLRNLYELALKLNVQLYQLQKRLLGSFNNGTFDGYTCWGSWIPGDEIDISVDTFGQCRKEVYAETGLEYTQRLIDTFGSAFLHIHGDAYHLLPEVVKLKGLRGIWLLDETPHFPYPFSSLAEIKKITGDMPLITECMLGEFLEGMEKGKLPGGVFYMVRGYREGCSDLMPPAVETVAEANEIMKKVRTYKSYIFREGSNAGSLSQ
jgi:hypothetical protein